jgi:hypothetical protein
MNVRALQLYLRSLATALAATGNPSAVPAELEAVTKGLEPFADLDFGRFAAFLRQAEQYRATGTVATNPDVDRAHAGLRALATLSDRLSASNPVDPMQLQQERAHGRQELQHALTAFLAPLAIDLTLKDNAKAFEALQQRLRMRPVAAQVRHALEGVSDEASLNQPERQQKLTALLDPLNDTQLKALAHELGVEISARAKKDSLPQAIVTGLTGIKPATAKKSSKGKASKVDPATIQRHAVNLKGLLEKAVDPDGVSAMEVTTAISELEGLKEGDLRSVAEEAGLENVGKKKKGILDKIRDKLTEARRAADSIQV